jgi:hypothetical protein
MMKQYIKHDVMVMEVNARSCGHFWKQALKSRDFNAQNRLLIRSIIKNVRIIKNVFDCHCHDHCYGIKCLLEYKSKGYKQSMNFYHRCASSCEALIPNKD